MSSYVGRFAPSPTGPLHAGSLVAALASYLDARAHDGRWLLRIEDLDPPREVPGAADAIVAELATLGFEADAPALFQSTRNAAYQQAFERLLRAGLVYPCACSRREIADSQPGPAPDGEAIYPGTCRAGLPAGRAARSWRLRVGDATIAWADRPAGWDHGRTQLSALAHEVGDFVVRRADGPWAYQLAVVVDDAWQGITDIVRGADLVDSTARQIHLRRLLGYPEIRTLHVPVVRAADGQKLSKQTGATPIAAADPLPALESALAHLGLAVPSPGTVGQFWRHAIRRWRDSPWTQGGT